MGKAIGIDLGTTNTAVAVLVDGRPRVLEDEKGYKVLPSCVSLKADGRFIVGQAARNLIITEPRRTCYAVKRLMGRRFDSDEASVARERMAYTIMEGSDGMCEVQLVDQTFSPVEICALILQVAKGIAERAVDELVDEAVITVPAYFNHSQRAATFEAAKLAGLRCERLLNEPTAAALAYGFRKYGEKTVVIYDLGGGTFDVSVLHINQGVYEILATKGDTFLGGEDLDFRLVDHLSDQFQSRTGHDLRTDLGGLQRVKDAAERAKCELSFTDRTTVLIPRVHNGENLEVAVSRLVLEGLVEDLVERTLQVTRQAVSEAGLNLSDVDDVILVGGQTRMPRVREAITGLFGKQPSRGVHPEEVVAIGAAVHASSLTDTSTPGPLLLDVTPFDLGIDVAGGLFQPIIARNNHVPAAASRLFATSQDNQESVVVRVRQGDSRFAEENEFLGEFVLSGLSPAPRMQTKVEVTFRIDMNGMLHCSAVEPATGEKRQITVRNYAEYAKGEGEVALDVKDGGASRVQPTAAPVPVEQHAAPPAPPVNPALDAALGPGRATTQTSAGQAGLLGRIFGRKRPQATPTPAPVAPGPTAAADDGPVDLPEDALQIEELPPAASEEVTQTGATPLISMPNLPPTSLGGGTTASEIDTGEFEAIPEGELVGFDDEESSPASIGLAGAGVDGWRPDRDALPDTPAAIRDESPLAYGTDELPELDHFGEDPNDFGSDDNEDVVDTGRFGVDEPNLIGRSADGDLFAMPDEGKEDEAPSPPMLPDEDLFAVPLVDEGTDIFNRAPASRSRTGRASGEFNGGSSVPAPDDETLVPKSEERLFDVRPPAANTSQGRRRRRKPARLKLAYRGVDALVSEYRENLRRGGCFVKTTKPLPVGRECRIEVRAPGLDEPIRLLGVVTWSSANQPTLAPGQDPGMGIEYRLDDGGREELERVLSELSV